jgi:hypothetical protein
MSFRLRKRKVPQQQDYAEDTFTQAWGTSTQWKSSTPRLHHAPPTIIAGSAYHQSPIRPKPKTPLNLNKPLPPLPPEARLLVPPTKSPLRSLPPLSEHPALRNQPPVSVQQQKCPHCAQPLPNSDVTAQLGSADVVDSYRHASTSGAIPRGRRRNLLLLPRTGQQQRSSDGVIDVSGRPLMIDRGCQTTPPPPELIKHAAAVPPPPMPPPTPPVPKQVTTPSRPSPMRAMFQRTSSDGPRPGKRMFQRTSSDDGKRTPLWSPRTTFKSGEHIDYFAQSTVEEASEPEDQASSKFVAHLKSLKSDPRASPLERPSIRRKLTKTDHTDSADTTGTHDSRNSSKKERPSMLRKNTASGERTVQHPKASPAESEKVRPRLQSPNSAPTVLVKAQKRTDAPPSPSTPSRPLPLPLQKLAFGHAQSSSSRRRQSRSDSSNGPTSPLRQELRRNDSMSDPPTPTSFKINRTRPGRTLSRDLNHIFANLGPEALEEEEEFKEYFMYQPPYVSQRPDPYIAALQAEHNVPDHLAGSPLCPMHPKHKTGGLGVCPYHGRRRSESIMNEDVDTPTSNQSSLRRPSSDAVEESLETRRASKSSIRRNSVMPISIPDEIRELRRRSTAESSNAASSHRSSASDSLKSALDDDDDAVATPTFKPGRQNSWAVGIDDGAVRGFGFRPPSPEPLLPLVRSPSALAREQRDADGEDERMPVRHRHWMEDARGVPGHTEVQEYVTMGSSSKRPKVHRGESVRGTKKGNTLLSKGGRVGIMIDSADSVPRFRM